MIFIKKLINNLYLKVFLESFLNNLPTRCNDNFLLKIFLVSKKIDFTWLVCLVILGFLLANIINFCLGFSLALLSNKFYKPNIKRQQIDFANFLLVYSNFIISIIILFFNYGYLGQFFVIFLGYAYCILIFHAKDLNGIYLYLIQWVFIMICVKFINILLIYYKI